MDEPLTGNLYTYAGNNPLNISDPSGHSWMSKAFSKAKNAVSSVANKIGDTVKSTATKIKDGISSAYNTVKTTVKKAAPR